MRPVDPAWFAAEFAVGFLLGLGLMAGARDQIAKLDVLPGLVAVFLIGFGADTVKSLLSTKS